MFGIVLGHGLMCYGWVYGGFCLSWVMVPTAGCCCGLVEVSARYTVYGEFYLSLLGGWLVSGWGLRVGSPGCRVRLSGVGDYETGGQGSDTG